MAFVSKALLLVAMLVFGWMYVNVSNLVKGKKAHDNSSASNDGFWGPDSASADVPGGEKGSPSTPFLAYFENGAYKLENDILFGRPTSFNASYEVSKQKYEDGMVSPDLYKIAAKIEPVNNKLLFQIQEREIEESFFKWLKLARVTHPKGTDIIVGSEYDKFFVLKTNELKKRVIMPNKIVARRSGVDLTSRIANADLMLEHTTVDKGSSISFQKDDSIELVFSGLKQDKILYLVTKSWFRDWIPGFSDDRAFSNTFAALFQRSPLNIARAMVLLALIPATWLLHKIGLGEGAFAIVPFIVGYEECSLVYEYKDSRGRYTKIAVSEPRAWRYNNEIIILPRESVSSGGELQLRITSTKRHTLGFVGVTQQIEDIEEKQFKQEEVRLTRAYHHRLEKDVTAELNSHGNEYVHMVTGDVVDLEFDAPKASMGENLKETYIIQSSGFYTALRPAYRRFADDWQAKRVAEDKGRRGQLVSLSSYK